MKYSRSIDVVFAFAFSSMVALSQQQPQFATPRRGEFSQVSAGEKPRGRIPGPSERARTPVFIENVGQFDSRVRFMAKVGGQTVWLTNAGVVFDSTRAREGDEAKQQVLPQKIMIGRPRSGSIDIPNSPRLVDRLAFSEDFVGESCSELEGKNQQQGAYNFFQGRNPEEWHVNVRGFAEVIYHDVWPGVDLRIYGKGPDLEQEFIVKPGGDLNHVQFSYRGIDDLTLAEDGSLEVGTVLGKMRETPPRIYQDIAGKQVVVDGHFELTSKNSYTFKVGAHAAQYALVIDPTLLYSTFLGGSGGHTGDAATGIAVDPSGSSYVVGPTGSTDFPTTIGAFQTTSAAGQTTFVTKLSPSGSGLTYSTYFGGFTEGQNSIVVDAAGQAYISGATLAAGGFPTTGGAYATQCSTRDGFVTVLNAQGNGLVYSTCFGASAEPTVNSIATDYRGRVAVAGTVSTQSLPTTANAYQPTYPGARGSSAFIMMFDTTASGAASLVYSTYFGIPSSNFYSYGVNGNAVAVDTYGNIYITGSAGDGLPVTAGAPQASLAGGIDCNPYGGQEWICPDAFVAKFNPSESGSQGLIYSTYLGGAGLDSGSAIAVDGSGSAYVTGVTQAISFPTTPGAFQTTCPGYPGYVFVSKVNAGGSRLVYSTCLAGNLYANNNSAGGIAVDSLGNAYIAGGFRAQTSATFPVTADAFQSSFVKLSGDSSEAFLTKLSPDGSALVYSSYLGGLGNDVATAVAIDQTGDAYVAGYTSSINFPTTGSVFQPTMKGAQNAFIAKFPLGPSQTLSISSVSPSSGGNSGTITIHVLGGGFHAGLTATLVGASTITGTPTVGTEGREWDVVFDLTGASVGLYALVVVNSDGTSVTKSNAFTVQLGGGPQLSVTIVGGSKVAIGHGPVAFAVIVSNIGSTDAIGGVLSLYGIPSGAILNPLFVMSPVPTLPGQTAVDFGQMPFASIVGQEQIPHLLLPPISVGASLTLSFSLAITALPPLPPLTPLSPSFIGSPPPNLTGLPAINITALASLIKYWCTTDCLDPTLVDLGIYGDLKDCAESGICVYLASVMAAGTKNPTDLVKALAQILLNCGKLAADVYGAEEVNQALNIIQTVLNCSKLVVGSAATQNISTSIDPNDKEGSTGVTASHWVPATSALPYGIYFLNEPSATAAAQTVNISDSLDPSIDLSTVALSSIVIGGVSVPAPTTFAPALGQNQASTIADFRPAQNLLVNLNVSLNPSSRILSWQFTSVDPITGLSPSDPGVGVLQPGVEGSIFYSAKLLQSVATGTTIANRAIIVFDTNPAMNTPSWINTIDGTVPVSHVASQPGSSTCPAFRVSWSGADTGSGLRGFTIYVSDTGAPFTAWISNTTATSADYVGATGHTYAFYSIATDLTGNMEGTKTSPEASTSVTAFGPCGAPSLSGQLSNVVQSGTTVMTTLTLTNTGFTAAQAVNINQVTFRTLSGSGTVTLANPAIPAAEGLLAIGASMNVPLTLSVPAAVTRFSMTESGTIQDGAGNTYNYSMAQTVIP